MDSGRGHFGKRRYKTSKLISVTSFFSFSLCHADNLQRYRDQVPLVDRLSRPAGHCHLNPGRWTFDRRDRHLANGVVLRLAFRETFVLGVASRCTLTFGLSDSSRNED